MRRTSKETIQTQSHHESITRQTALNKITLRGGILEENFLVREEISSKIKTSLLTGWKHYDDYFAFSSILSNHLHHQTKF